MPAPDEPGHDESIVVLAVVVVRIASLRFGVQHHSIEIDVFGQIHEGVHGRNRDMTICADARAWPP